MARAWPAPIASCGRASKRCRGVQAAGGVSALPLSDFAAWGPITIEGHTPPSGERFINADQRTVAGHYFEAMRIPLRRGRLFDEHDTADTERVVIIDEKLPSGTGLGRIPSASD